MRSYRGIVDYYLTVDSLTVVNVNSCTITWVIREKVK